MSTQIDDQIEHDLRQALRAAAGTVHPTLRPLPGAIARGAGSDHRPSGRRWVMPAVAASVVAAIGLPLLAFTLLRGASGPDIDAAAGVTVSGGRATVAGISFPMPDGWTAKTVGTTDTSVTVCVATQPARACDDGVTLRIAVPDGGGDITPLPGPLAGTRDPAAIVAHSAGPASTSGVVPSAGATGGLSEAGASGIAVMNPPVQASRHPRTETCIQISDTDPIGSRPAVHFSLGPWPCAPGGAQSADWFVTDGSLEIFTPRGAAHQQAARIVAGLDFSAYQHAYGPQIMMLSEPGVASSHDAAPTR